MELSVYRVLLIYQVLLKIICFICFYLIICEFFKCVFHYNFDYFDIEIFFIVFLFTVHLEQKISHSVRLPLSLNLKLLAVATTFSSLHRFSFHRDNHKTEQVEVFKFGLSKNTYSHWQASHYKHLLIPINVYLPNIYSLNIIWISYQTQDSESDKSNCDSWWYFCGFVRFT